MPKATTAERLAQAITKNRTRIEEYIKKIASSNIRNGFCVIMPTHTGAPPLTNERLDAIKNNVLQVFKNENLFGLAIQYFIPPEGSLRSSKPDGRSDYEIRAGIAEFDAGWQVDQFAKAILYCPGESELGRWNPRYDRLSEGLRLTPLFDMAVKDIRARGGVNEFLHQLAEPYFKKLTADYAKIDPSFPEADRFNDIRVLYHEISDFPVEGAPIFHAYAQARALRKNSRNPKINGLMDAFIRAVEKQSVEIISQIGASSETQGQILKELRQDFSDGKAGYQAERPARSLSYFRVAQLLMLFTLKFLENPSENFASGEIAMFIWLAQHVSFEGISGILVTDFLGLQVTDFVRDENSLRIRGKKIKLTEGLGELLRAWIGDAPRKNSRWLFTELKPEFLTDNLTRMSKELPAFASAVLSKDLLLKPNAIPHDSIIDRNLLSHLNWQADFVSKSPHANSNFLAELIREKIASSLSMSNN